MEGIQKVYDFLWRELREWRDVLSEGCQGRLLQDDGAGGNNHILKDKRYERTSITGHA